MNIEALREQLKVDEGVKYEIYKDHLGYPTFGIGHLITEDDPEHGEPDGTEISEDRVNEVFESDVATFVSEAKILFPDLDELPDVAQQVIVNMAFNMGRPRLSKFKNFIAGVNDRDWVRAAEEMMDSRWATQVGDRAIRLRNLILTLA
ncbi:MAG: glycoside hydrolase family protein [Pelagibacteraceae bacterium]|nr:glycoside hydrolase family protein [Pelagibacteraceae bacterium]